MTLQCFHQGLQDQTFVQQGTITAKREQPDLNTMTSYISYVVVQIGIRMASNCCAKCLQLMYNLNWAEWESWRGYGLINLNGLLTDHQLLNQENKDIFKC